MSVIVKGIFGKEMPMPQEGYVDIRLHFKGGRIECATMPIGNPPYYATFKVVKLPPHGRLIEADKLKAQYVHGKADDEIESAWISNIRRAIANAPTIIEAEGSDE